MPDSVTPPPPSAQPPVDFKKIIEESTHPDPGLTSEGQTSFIHRYSFAALIWQFVYFFAMGDYLLAWLSIGCSVIFIFSPLLLIFPIWARRRAYQTHRWSGFNEFYYSQKKWDRSALYLTIATVVLGLISFWLIGPAVLNSIHTVTGTTDSSGNINQQLQDTIKQYQDVLGQ